MDPICTEKRSLWATPKMEKHFFGKNKKSRSSAFRKFLFYQNIMFWVSYESFSIFSDVFCQKSVISSSENSCAFSLLHFLWLSFIIFWSFVYLFIYSAICVLQCPLFPRLPGVCYDSIYKCWNYLSSLMVKVLAGDCQSSSRGPVFKPLGGSKVVDSAFHPSFKVDKLGKYEGFLGT